MNILLFLIPVSMAALILAAVAFVWAVKRGQFEDLDTPALDILREDEHDRLPPEPEPEPEPAPAPAPPSSTEPTAESPSTGAAQPAPTGHDD